MLAFYCCATIVSVTVTLYLCKCIYSCICIVFFFIYIFARLRPLAATSRNILKAKKAMSDSGSQMRLIMREQGRAGEGGGKEEWQWVSLRNFV